MHKQDINELQWNVRNNGFIYCPACGSQIYPEIPTFTDDNPDGSYTCEGCTAQITISFDGYEGD